MAVLVESLKRRGVSETVIEEALTEVARKWPYLTEMTGIRS